MQVVKDGISREQVEWLALHAAGLIFLGALMAGISVAAFVDGGGWLAEGLLLAAGGVTTGTGVALLGAVLGRLRRPFAAIRMAFRFGRYALLEAMVIAVVAGMLPDGGETAFRFAALILAVNLALFGFKRM